jgi:hypothetical protein
MMAAISKPQVIISISAKVPNMALGVPFILQAYCSNLAKPGTSRAAALSALITLVLRLVTGFTGVVKGFWIGSIW